MYEHKYSIKILTPSSGKDILINFRKSVMFSFTKVVLKNFFNATKLTTRVLETY